MPLGPPVMQSLRPHAADGALVKGFQDSNDNMIMKL